MTDKKKDTTPSIWRFIITYVFLMGLFFIVMGFAPIQEYFDVNDLYSRAVVVITAGVLNIFNIETTASGTVIHLPGISLEVLFGCNGLEAVMIYTIAILAFPASRKNKLIGITAGFFIIQVVNILRIVALAYAAVHFKQIFKILHIYVAQGLMVAIALGMFFIYLDYTRKENEKILSS